VKTTVADSSPLIAFIKKEEFQVLKTLFTTIHVPASVHEELTQGQGSSPVQVGKIHEAVREGWIIIDAPLKLRIPDLPLGKGESEAINACLTDPASYLLLMDEKKGRRIAQVHGIKTLGTMGIITLAFKTKKQKKEESMEDLKKLLSSGFYLSSDAVIAFTEFLNKP